MRFMFCWSLVGSTLVEAETLEEARDKFDDMTTKEIGAAEAGFELNSIMISSENNGCFDTEVES